MAMNAMVSVTTSQALNTGAVAWSPTYAQMNPIPNSTLPIFPRYLTLHVGGSMVAVQTFTVTLNSVAGANHDTLLYSAEMAIGLTDLYYPFDEAIREHGLKNLDLLDIALTNVLAPAVTAYLELFYQV